MGAPTELLEITDVIVDCDPDTLKRRPVSRAAAVAKLQGLGQRRAARLVDALFVRAHSELQRLEEEFMQGERVRSLLLPLLQVLRDGKVPGPYRVVDVGCGLGYVTRWLAACGGLGGDVELYGCDYNRALVTAASEAARAEGLRCEFKVANAFRLADPATIFTSSGFIHHFRGAHLPRVFTEQDGAGAQGVLHFDIKRSWLAPLDGLGDPRPPGGPAPRGGARRGTRTALHAVRRAGRAAADPPHDAGAGRRSPPVDRALRARLGSDSSRLGAFA